MVINGLAVDEDELDIIQHTLQNELAEEERYLRRVEAWAYSRNRKSNDNEYEYD